MAAIIAVAAVALGAAGASASPSFLAGQRVGRQPDGSVVTSTNQRITPAGTQVEFPGRPVTVRTQPNGQTAVTLNARGGALLVVTDLATGKVRQQFTPKGSGRGSFEGLAYSHDGRSLFASRADGSIARATVADDGTLTDAGSIAIPEHDVVLLGHKAYVTNQGGRLARAGDVTNDSSGTAVVADPKTGGATNGTVSVVDLAAGRTAATVEVGVQPTGAYVAGTNVFVANSMSDTVSVLDTRTDRVAETLDVRPGRDLPLGSQPNAVILDDQQHLLVSLGRTNAVAAYEFRGLGYRARFLGLMPTGWYPASLALDTQRRRLVVANDKGVGSLGPVADDGGHYVKSYVGSLSLIPLNFGEHQLEHWTEQVLENTGLDGGEGEQSEASPRPNVAPTAVPAQTGEPSTIKHVFYVIKENRTYDQVLGDLGRGNGDPSLTVYGRQVTPNQHALTQRFPLLDNFYAGGDVSADGHQWDVQANVPDYLERATGAFNRSYPYNGGDALAYEKTGFLWGNAMRHGKTVADFGEYAPSFDGPDDQFGTWSDWYHDYLKLSGQEAGQPHVAVGTFQTHTDVPELDPLLIREYPNFTMDIPDQYRELIFERHFDGWVKSNSLPDLVFMHLPDDHTAADDPANPTPQAMNADNDLALAKIVDKISHSPYWKDSAIFVTEDDAQDGTDHVDGHRTTGYVISPYTRTGLVDSHYWTQTNMARTIEQILGPPPMNQMDLAASPMRELFTDKPDLTPYTVRPNEIPLDTLNGSPAAAAQATSTAASVKLRKAWQAATAAMGFHRRDTAPDEVDRNLMSHATFYASTGYTRPYPGEARVLLPSEVRLVEGAQTGDPGDQGASDADG